MSNNLIELESIARLLHQGWVMYKTQQGVVFGPDRSEATHPHIVDWEELDEESRNQDRFTAATILRDWTIGVLGIEDFPAAIHNGWAMAIASTGRKNPHAIPFHQAHVDDPAEHGIQASLVTGYLANFSTIERYSKYDRKCLALLPFRAPTLLVYDEVVGDAIKQSGYIPVRADKLRSPQSIHDEVIDQIELCSAVIADLSGDNPNVNYEIGIARSLGKPIIMISSSRDPASVPFYYKGQRVHFYNRDEEDWKKSLSEYIRLSLANAIRLDPLSVNQKLGLTGLYVADDQSFETELKRQITLTSSRIVAVGWGLAFLNRQRREVMDVLRHQLLSKPSLTVHIILVRPDHPGIVERIREEEAFQPQTGILTDWQQEFFNFAMELPHSLEGDNAKERVFVRRLSYLPTAMVVRLDDVVFFRCYGPPNIGGWQSPWLRCQRSLAEKTWVGFLDNFIEQAVTHSFDPRRSTNRPTERNTPTWPAT